LLSLCLYSLSSARVLAQLSQSPQIRSVKFLSKGFGLSF
ncbi:hypothetical protein CMV_022837, partial [Castanea mollissima]